VHRLIWQGVSEIVDDAFSDYGQSEGARGYLRDLLKERSGSTWANRHTRDTIKLAVSEPAEDLVKTIETMTQRIAGEVALPAKPRRRVRRGQAEGELLDSDRILAREPDAWEKSVRESAPHVAVTIGVNLTVACLQTPRELLYRGAAAIALAGQLIQRGLNVRVIGYSVGAECSSTVDRLVSVIELKAADMPLDIASDGHRPQRWHHQ
jgi:hypothetical protein